MSGDYKVDLSFGNNNSKDWQNRMALTGDGAVKGLIYGSGTANAISLADGSGAYQDITVNGVALGDIVLGASYGVDTDDATCTASVTAANVVTIVRQNESGSVCSMASTTVRILVADVT